MRQRSAPFRHGLVVFAALAAVWSAGWSAEPATTAPGPRLTLDDIVAGGQFDDEVLRNLRWLPDGSGFIYLQRTADGPWALMRHDLARGVAEPLVAEAPLEYAGEVIDVSGFELSADQRYLLLRGPQTRTWRNLFEAVHYLVDLERGETVRLAAGDPSLRNVQFSPDATQLGYVQDNNLFVMALASGEIRAVTRDGSEDILNGVMDYVTAQALRNAVGWRWSPDSERVVFWRSDVSHMPLFHMVDELQGYNVVRGFKYPIVGVKNAVIAIGVHTLDAGRTVWMALGDDDSVMIPRVDWTPDGTQLAIQRLNRPHNRLELLLADADTGQSRVILSDEDPAWVEVHDDLRLLADGEHLVWTSERSGYRHAYLFALDGSLQRALTAGDWEITSLVDVDPQGGWLYFYAKKDSFIDQPVYRVSLEGGEVERVSSAAGWYEWTLAPDGATAVEVYSNVTTPPQTRLRGLRDGSLRTLLDNRPPGLAREDLPHPEFRQIETRDGVTLNVSLMTPPGFDPERRYPVLAYGYGNAGSQRVVNRWGGERELWHRYMADQGYLVFRLDNRTTAGRGKAARNLTYGHYAKWAVHDQLEGAHYLGSLPYVDPERLGFWGWSGGGYLAAALMTKGEGHFRVGVSVAPVINLENYQSIGVERWMGRPETNPEGYYQVNLENFADGLEGRLLLVHGTGDENVKYAFTLQFAQSLVAAGKSFDMMIYPNEHHDLAGVRRHLYQIMSDYFDRHLATGSEP
ncbi:MAG: DPP IV N-terminal domain-containing protein [Gammaproteobacteria bacterium]|nr:DPP IV N-terminal domain-containing protein [Gammaproteobacteria bacterium]